MDYDVSNANGTEVIKHKSAEPGVGREAFGSNSLPCFRIDNLDIGYTDKIQKVTHLSGSGECRG